MKFSVEQSALVDGVNWVSRSLSTRPIKTELLGIVFNATNDAVYLSASDLETASKSHFQAEVKEPGKVLVPVKDFAASAIVRARSRALVETLGVVGSH